MTGTQILEKFYLQVDDSSELSDEEALDLANDVYHEIQDDRDWEWLKATQTGTLSTSVPYVSLPASFKKLALNKENKTVVFVGSDYKEYKVIAFADRRNYRNQDGFCYVDIPNQRLYFTKQPTSADSYEYDYIKTDDILAGTEPLFRDGYHKIIAIGMAARFPIIEMTDKNSSYRGENQGLYIALLQEMAEEDANIKLSL